MDGVVELREFEVVELGFVEVIVGWLEAVG